MLFFKEKDCVVLLLLSGPTKAGPGSALGPDLLAWPKAGRPEGKSVGVKLKQAKGPTSPPAEQGLGLARQAEGLLCWAHGGLLPAQGAASPLPVLLLMLQLPVSCWLPCGRLGPAPPLLQLTSSPEEVRSRPG